MLSKEKTKIIKNMIEKECQRFSLKDLCESWDVSTDEFYEFLNMAIKALEQQPCPYWDYGLNTCRHANIGALATKPCEDAVEVWDGIHCQIVAPKGTFDKIYNDAEENEKAISVKDAIRVIKSWFEKIELNPDILIDSIISLPSVQPKSSWIPVSEKLPDMGKYVLCSVNKIYESDLEVVITQFRNEGWWTDGRINAWMPLPEPYKADKGEEE